LIIDNYDSFVHNIAQYVGKLGCSPVVHRNDRITLREAEEVMPDRVVVSPGPGSPEDARSFGISLEMIKVMGRAIPTLGICLGHQGVVYAFGGRIVRAGRPMHGKTSLIKHDSKGIFRGIENPFEATRYHSLVSSREGFPFAELEITAESLDDGEIMGVRHRTYPIVGLQFHPESILTKPGLGILKNFLYEGV